MLNILIAALLAQQDVDAALDALAAVKPGEADAYVATRDRVLAFGAAALKDRGAAGRWTADGWVRAMAAEACRVRLENGELARSVDTPRGLLPAEYAQFKMRAPMCTQELVRAGADGVPLLLERWRWTMTKFAFSEGDAGKREEDCYRHAILFVPGQIADARARHFLSEVLASKDREAWRQQAAVSLGQCGGTEALAPLTQTLDAAETPGLREACARAIGRVPEREALDAIRSRLATERDDLVRRSLIHGLGILGSSWGWDSRKNVAAGKADEIRKACAEALVDVLSRLPSEQETIGLALGMVAWPDSENAVEALASSSSADVKDAAAKVLPVLKRALSRRK